MIPLSKYDAVGIGKACLVVANGYSLEENIETIKKHKDNVDIMCCDKTLGFLLDNGITPTYCMVCDARVDYDTYMKPWEDKLQDIVCFINVCGNTKWTDNGNWKEIVFFVNKDILKSEIEFSELSGCKNFIPAGTNVSNAMLVFLTQSDNDFGGRNAFGYDKYLLTGYDYSWTPDANYYAGSKDGGGKFNYMRHQYMPNMNGNLCYTSNNLLFSARWLDMYCKAFKIPAVQTTKRGIFHCNTNDDLSKQMSYRHKPEDSHKIRTMQKDYNKCVKLKRELEAKITAIARDHHDSFAASI
jgi:hypothetical protein